MQQVFPLGLTGQPGLIQTSSPIFDDAFARRDGLPFFSDNDLLLETLDHRLLDIMQPRNLFHSMPAQPPLQVQQPMPDPQHLQHLQQQQQQQNCWQLPTSTMPAPVMPVSTSTPDLVKEDTDMEPVAPPAVQQALKRQTKLREKNARAQQRYREKQKNLMETLKAELEETTAKLAKLERDNKSLSMRNDLLEKVQCLNNTSQQNELQKLSPAKMQFLEAVGRLWKIVDPAFEAQLPTDLSNITVAQWFRLWTEYNNQLSVLLSEGASEPGSPAHKRLEELVLAARGQSMQLSASDPRMALRIKAMLERESAARHGGSSKAPADVSKRVLAVMELQPEQETKLLELHKQMMVSAGHLLAERREILSSLQALMPSNQADLFSPGANTKAYEVADRLRENLDEERRCVMRASRSFRCELLTPLQEARCYVETFPWSPMNFLPLVELLQPGSTQTPLLPVLEMKQCSLSEAGASSLAP